MADIHVNSLLTSNVQGAKVKFLNGTQEKLNTLMAGGAIEGAFYLTSDTHRLYVGQKKSSTDSTVIPVPVNQGVTTVDSVKDLNAEAGAFYYVTDSNILCVYNGVDWVQINPDTDTYISAIDMTFGTDESGATTIQTALTQSVKGGAGGGGTVIDDSLKIVGASGTTVSASGDVLTITGDTYNLDASVDAETGAATIALKSNVVDDSITISSANDNLTISEGSEGELVLTAKDTTLATDGVTSGFGASPTDEGVDAGDGTKVKEGFYINVKDSAGNEDAAQINPEISINNNSVKFIDGKAVLDVYSKTQIDEKMKALDAMTYKGTVGTGGSVTIDTSALHNGDTFLVVGDDLTLITGSGDDVTTITAKPGDLVIARGTETDGIITSGLEYDIVPSGNDLNTDTTYSGAAVDNGMSIKNSDGGVIATIAVQGDGTYITTADTATTDSDSSNTITLSHKTVEVVNTPLAKQEKEESFSAVVAVTRDGAGHVTEVQTQQFTPNYRNVSAVAYTAANDENKTTATVTNSVSTTTLSGTTTTASGKMAISSSTLEVTTKEANAETGAPVTVVMDMVWGSF